MWRDTFWAYGGCPPGGVPLTPVCMPGVVSFNGRTGAVTLNQNDIIAAGGAISGGPGGNWAPINSPNFTGTPTAPTPPPGTDNNQIATTAFVDQAIAAALAGTGGGTTAGVTSWNGRTGVVVLTLSDILAAGGAPLSSPAFAGVPTASTAAPGTSTNQLATTAFVMAALAGLGSGTSGVLSFNNRTGAVTLTLADITGVGGAPVNSPVFTGIPSGPTAAPGTSSTQLATTAFVQNAIQGLGSGTVAGVSSFNGRTGAVTFTAADITNVGGALLASPAFTGSPTAPTASPGTSNTQIATTAFVMAAIAAAGLAANGLPTGGTAGQILQKTSSTNYAATWITPGTYVQLTSAVNFAAYPTVTQTTVTVGTLQPGDWDLTVSCAAQSGNLGSIDYFLSPVPSGMQNQMRGTMFVSQPGGTRIGIQDSNVVGQPGRINITTATAITFSVRLDNSVDSSSGAGVANLVLTARKWV